MNIKRKHFVWAGVAVAAAAVLWAALREKPLEADTAVVRLGTLQVTVDADGKTRVRDRYVLTAPVAGRLQRIDMPEGTQIRAGDVVARIAPLPLDAQAVRQADARIAAAQALVSDAETRVRQARASLAQEQRTAGRITRLVSAGALADRDGEDAVLAVRLRDDELAGALARQRAAVADVAQARAALVAVGGGTPGTVVAVRAPADGCLLRVPERSERVVTPGAPIADIGDPGAMELVVDILSSDAARVRPAARVLVDGWGDGEALAAHVQRIEPAAFTHVSALGVEEQRVNVIIAIDRAPPELGDGYRVDARIIVWEQANTVMLPVSALFRDGAERAVYVVRNGRAELRHVQVGEQSATDAQVLTGVEVGDRVMIFPSDQIKTGRRVAPAR